MPLGDRCQLARGGIAGLIALIAAGYLAQLAIWIMWPRKVEERVHE